MQIPGFEILSKLSDTPAATVWKARRLQPDRVVAIKMPVTPVAKDPEILAKFQTGVHASALLRHENLLAVYDCGEAGGQAFLAMEYIEGRGLDDIIARKGRLREEKALAIAECVAHALKYAWDEGQMTHGDINPANILLSNDGVVKVAALGMVRSIERRRAEAAGPLSGDLHYIAPEQAAYEKDTDYRADIYSLGATLFHMITGVMPFAGASGAAALENHRNGFLPDPQDVNPSVSAPAAWLIEKMMVRNRGDRYTTWTEVIEDIEQVIQGNMPRLPLPEAGHSTVSRSGSRTIPAVRPAPAAPQQPLPLPRPTTTPYADLGEPIVRVDSAPAPLRPLPPPPLLANPPGPQPQPIRLAPEPDQ